MLLNHINCLSLLLVRASPVVVNLGYARRIASMNFKKFFAATRLITFVQEGVHDQDADTRPWITDTCAASMALKASSSIFIKCHILPKLTLLTTRIVDDLPRQRNLKKLGIKRTWSPGVKRQTKNSTRQTKTKSRKIQQNSDSRG